MADSTGSTGLHHKTFLLLLAAVTIAFFWILLPFYGAVFWGAVLAIIFAPLQRWLVARLKGRANIASLLTLLLVLLLVILPLTLISISLVNEGINLYESIKSGQINFGVYFQRAVDALPPYFRELLSRFDVQSLSDLQQKLSASAMQTSQFLATRALSIGQNTAHMLIGFGIMMYLLFFLLRDGPQLSRRVRIAVPLSTAHKQHLIKKFTMVVRATVKGNIAVAVVQGTLGGVIFAVLGIQGSLLWGAIMAFLSLLPAVGAALIWLPVAVYFLLTGDLVKGFVLIGFGTLVIGMVDNVLRPILVGKDTQMPDYVVLISTLGGMALFGLNGFVIGPLVAALFIACWDLHSIGEGAPPETLREEARSGAAREEAREARKALAVEDRTSDRANDRATTD
ncbi:AI-2E family transporter [Cupriavidus plantarum]|uniref:Putative PurR-regulated permease PerM n=1 Tax=Cupriavidus plantarum TaxID=942865 RepID=A0A316EQI1_9BURK|nr:AI-2E family transporter [Cupriavidus plantarum]PWK34335.1 putative PurR-regulated permease PerM [Cupriavidus plantarum]CAG2138526.1 Putative transport protein YdiK [Cupriavidus plantarum]SMR85861.1 Predicted PurR-regulated permease PerM [Cupriavidus plantarum]